MVTRRQLLQDAGRWLIDVEVGGRLLRFGTARAEITKANGDVVLYKEGLADFTQAISTDGATDFSVPLTIDAGEDWEAFVANYVVVERAPATLRRWHEGQLLEEARVVATGFVDGFRYREQDEPVGFNLRRRIRAFSRDLPSPGMVVDEITWPVRAGTETDERILGAPYPIIFGFPGLLADGSVVAATEALLVEIDVPGGGSNRTRLLVAGHRVQADEVTLFDYTDPGEPTSQVMSIIETADGVGRIVSLAEDPPGSSLSMEVGRSYYVGWNGGGLGNPVGQGTLVGAADLIEWFLKTWTNTRLDNGRFAGIRDRLNRYLISTWMNSPMDPTEWLNANVYPLLPIDPVQSEEGLWFRLRNFGSTPGDAIASLNADTGEIQLASDVQTISENLINEVTIEYGMDRATGRFRFRVIVGADERSRPLDEFQADLEDTDTRFVANYRASLSQADYGRQSVTIEAPAVWDAATAVLIAQDIIEQQALPRRVVSYQGGEDLAVFEENDVVTIRHTAVKLNDVLARVVDSTIGGPTVTLELDIFDDPALMRRVAS